LFVQQGFRLRTELTVRLRRYLPRIVCATKDSGPSSRSRVVVRVCECSVMGEAWQRVTAEIAEVAARPVYGLSDAQLAEDATGLYRVVSAATAAVAALVREAQGRDLPHQNGAASTVGWLRDLLRIGPAEARQLVALGEVLDTRPALSEAVVAGAVNASQAVAIGHVLADVPDRDPILVDRVEAVLAEYAHQFEPTILRRLGERVLAHLNPELADRGYPKRRKGK
jgi:hypothetical protein